MAIKLLPIVLGTSALGLILFTASKSKAADSDVDPTPIPPSPNPGPNPSPGPPLNIPPGAGTAVVLTTPAMKVRTLPNVNATRVGRAEVGATVAVLQTYIADQSNSGRIWWRIISPASGGWPLTEGYVSAIDPEGVSNFRLITSPTAPPGPSPIVSGWGRRFY